VFQTHHAYHLLIFNIFIIQKSGFKTGITINLKKSLRNGRHLKKLAPRTYGVLRERGLEYPLFDGLKPMSISKRLV
jgi:hypothetical protein